MSVIQSFKKVINHAEASLGTGIQQFNATIGTDSVAAGQTSAIDFNVPTGSVVKYIEFQFVQSNLALVTMFTHASIQLLHSGQSVIDPLVVGGNPQRNQVFHQDLFSVGQNQNTNRSYKFKIPKKYQRVREGDKWALVTKSSQTSTGAVQIIYKFYR